jgi:sugar phosphate isomerase/epimerase
MRIGTTYEPYRMGEDPRVVGQIGLNAIDIIAAGELLWERFFNDNAYLKALQDCIRQLGLKASVHAQLSRFVQMPETTIKQSADREIELLARIAKRLGCWCVSFDVLSKYCCEESAADSINDTNAVLLEKISKICDEQGLDVAFENLPWGAGSCDSPEKMRELKRNVSAPNLGFLIDVGHVHIREKWTIDDYLALADNIKYFHLSDNHFERDDHLPLGTAKIDYAYVVTRIREELREPCLMIETTTEGEWVPANCIDGTKRSFQYLNGLVLTETETE